MLRKILSFAALLLAASAAMGQPDSSLHSGWHWSLNATTFFRDAEFFLPEAKGYTMSGFRLTPTIDYHSSQFSFSGGIRLSGIAGSHQFAHAAPVLSLVYHPSQWLSLTMGTLQSDAHHHLGEPLYDLERWYWDYQEDGLQITTNTHFWNSDTWINWENFLQPWTPDQERFTLGSAHEFNVLTSYNYDNEFGKYNVIEVTTPLAFIGCHRGGQFSTLDTCIETLFNESVGLKIAYRPSSNKCFHLNIPWYFYQNKSPLKERYTPFDEGHAFHPQFQCSFKPRRDTLASYCASFGYYHGHQYISPRGSYLFQSISWFDPFFSEADRQMLTSNISISKRVSAFSINLNAQFYYDLHHQKLDFALGLIMQFQKNNQNFRQ